jgi:hypothetical protein
VRRGSLPACIPKRSAAESSAAACQCSNDVPRFHAPLQGPVANHEGAGRKGLRRARGGNARHSSMCPIPEYRRGHRHLPTAHPDRSHAANHTSEKEEWHGAARTCACTSHPSRTLSNCGVCCRHSIWLGQGRDKSELLCRLFPRGVNAPLGGGRCPLSAVRCPLSAVVCRLS